MALSGCGNAQLEAQRAEVAKRDAKFAVCNQQFDEHHVVARVKCRSTVQEHYLHIYRYPDLVRLMDANGKVIAARVGAGEITYAEGKLKGAQMIAQINNEGEQRDAVRAAANAARMRAAAAIWVR